MPKNGFPMQTAKNEFHIFNLHPKKYIFKKKNTFFNANLLEKFLYFPSYNFTFGKFYF